MPDASVPSPFWLSAFLDLPSVQFSPGVEFWSVVTGYSRSPARGGSGEFATLLPAQGDGYLHVQRLESGPARIHLDLHVADPEAAAVAAVGIGATVVARADPGYVVLASPGGLVFCFVSYPASARPEPTSWPGVGRSLVYQVCLDIPPKAYDVECAFWAGVLGGTVELLPRRTEFSWVRGPRQLALDVLLQRLEADVAADGVTVHLDVGTTDRAAEVARHVDLGATGEVVEEFWTVLADPTGTAYCITDRDPATGTLT